MFIFLCIIKQEITTICSKSVLKRSSATPQRCSDCVSTRNSGLGDRDRSKKLTIFNSGVLSHTPKGWGGGIKTKNYHIWEGISGYMEKDMPAIPRPQLIYELKNWIFGLFFQCSYWVRYFAKVTAQKVLQQFN